MYGCIYQHLIIQKKIVAKNVFFAININNIENQIE